MLRDVYHRVRHHTRQSWNGRIDKKLFFLHIPKCGGTSLVAAIRQGFITLNPREDRYLVHLDPFAIYEASQSLGREPLEYSKELLFYYLSSKENKFVYGHFAIDDTVIDTFREKFVFMIMLRDPIKKWLSGYFFKRYKDDHYFGIEDSLETYLESPESQWQGYDYVSRLIINAPDQDFASPPAIDQAIANLKHFDLVGDLERMDVFAEEFEGLLGRKLRMKRLNKSPASKSFQESQISDELLERVKEACRPNLAVYHYASAHLIGRHYAGSEKQVNYDG